MINLLKPSLRSKRNVLETAIIASHKTGTVIGLQEFRKVVSVVMKTDIADDRWKHYYKD
jgi:hypothetical protein